MTSQALAEIFADLPRPTSTDSISAARADQGSRLRVGKSSRGECGLLLELASSDPVSHGIRLHFIEYQPSVDVRVEVDGEHQQGRFALLMCRSPDDELRRYFFRITEGLTLEIGRDPSFTDFDHSVRRVVELFEALNRPGRRTIQGLWAELLLLANAADPRLGALAWHSTPSDRFDFEQGASCVEVKGTVSALREHEIALDQLTAHTDGETTLASLLLRRDDGGSSIEDLAETALRRIGDHGELRQRVEAIIAASLGDQWRDGQLVRFDAESSLASLRFFSAQSIPSIHHSAIPAEISRVRFRVDLSGTEALDQPQISANALLRALAPATTR